MAIIGKKLVKPSLHEPYALIGESLALDPSGKPVYDLGKVSGSNKVNRWSAVKPTANMPFFVDDDAQFRLLAGQSGVDFGFDFSKIIRNSVQEAAEAAAANGNTWPVREDPHPVYSLSHWNGYDHAAVPVGGLSAPLKDLEVVPGQEVTVYFSDTGTIRMAELSHNKGAQRKWFVALIYSTSGSVDQKVITHISPTAIPDGQSLVPYDQITFEAPEEERPWTMIQGIGSFPQGGTTHSMIYLPFTLRKLNVSSNPWSATQRFVFGGPNWSTMLRFTYAESEILVVNNRTYPITVVPFVESRIGEGYLPLRHYVGTNNATLTSFSLASTSRDTYTVRREVPETAAADSWEYRVGIVVDGFAKYLTDWFTAYNYIPIN